MNKFLLDTHILNWLMFSPKLISKHLIALISKEENELFVSAISLWEMSIKYKLGKLDLGHYTPKEIMNLCGEYKIHVVGLNTNEAATLFELEATYHKDPFDRILIWQAIQNNYTFITDDKNIKMYKSEGLKTIW
jgi:PIN domain nuclease of toxin-antitoxin system